MALMAGPEGMRLYGPCHCLNSIKSDKNNSKLKGAGCAPCSKSLSLFLDSPFRKKGQANILYVGTSWVINK